MNHSYKNSSSKKSTLIKLLIYVLVIGSFLTLPLNVQAGVSTHDTSENLFRIRSGQTGATQKSPVTRGDLIGKLRPPFSPAPSVTVSTGGVLLGENFNITATFENNGTASGYGPTGYGPFIDLYLPHKGADGVYPTELTYDGISPASGPNYTATLPDGEVLNVITQTFPDDGGGTGCVNHPWGLDTAGFFLSVCGTAGDQLVSIELPYGSYTPAQPTLTVTIPARLSEYANPGTPLTIRGRGGFKYGATPAIDWCCTVPIDTTIVSDSGAPATWVPFSSVNPSVISFSKNTSAGEVATGPNSPATFTISVDLAPNQIFNDIDISDIVPNNLVYLGGLSTSPAADTISQPAVDGFPHNGDSISLHWDGPIDSSVFSSISASFNYYIPEFDADGFDIAPGITQNQATLDQIWWSPADGASDQELSSSVGVGTATTSDQPLTLAKASTIVINNGPSGYTPEDVIQYSLSFQISDYFGFDNLSLEDILPDGQHYYTDGTYQPSLSITRDGSTISYSFDADNITVDCNYTGAPGSECDLASSTGSPGQTTVSFDIDQELTDQLVNSQVLGDLVNDAGPTANSTVTGTVLFYAEMLDKYTDIFASPDNYVKMGDSQNNSAVITGDQVNPATCNPGPCTITATVSGNSASNTVNVGSGTLDKAIVAVNGAYCAGGNPCSDVNIAAGDTVTYRILYDLLTGDYSDLSFTDFLPLPIFYAEDPNVDGSSLTSWPQDLVNAIPDPGTWILGPNDDRGHLPSNVSISPHSADNSVIFEFGDFDDTDNLPKSIELHFTVRVTDEQFGDGLRMRNSVLQQDSNSPGVTSTSNNNVDLTLTEPVLVGDKSVVSTDHAGIDPDPTIAAPIVFLDPGDTVNPPWNTGSPINSTYLDANSLNSGIDGIDGGDLVKFVLIIENTGSGINGAYDIALRDHLPPGYLLPGFGLGGFNLQVYRGDGLALDDGTGSGLEFLGTNNDATDFFDNGIRLRDPEDNPAFAPSDPEYGQGLCQAHEAASGKNVIILTYDLLVDPDVSPGSVLQNDGEIITYSGEEGGEDYIPGPGEGSTDSTIDVHELDKQRTGTELDVTNNDDDQVVIGEEVYYELIVTFPEGISPSMVIIDSLDIGLGFVSQDSFVISNGDSGVGDADGGISFTGSEVPVVTNSGRTITWNLGDVSNTNDDNSVAETLTFTYTVLTLNVTGNQHNTPLNNSVEITWDTLDADGNNVTGMGGPESATDVIVVEPQIDVTKAVVVGGSGISGDAGDSVVYTITFTSDASRPTAFEADLSDILSTDIEFATCPGCGITAVTDTAGVLGIGSFEIFTGNELRLVGDVPIDMALGRQVVITLTGELKDTVYTGQTINNDADVSWTSRTGDVNSGAETGERTGQDGAGGLNNYVNTGSAPIDVVDPEPQKLIVTTSEVHTGTIGDPRLVIGEIIRYRLEVRLAEGTTNDLILRDNLLPGMIFINDGTAKVIFVSTSGIDIDSQDSAVPDVVPGIDDPTAFRDDSIPLINIVPVYVLPDGNISSSLDGNNDTYNSGSYVYFKLGDVFNSELDDNGEYAVIEFNALVANDGDTYSGRTRSNTFSVYADEDGDGNAEASEILDTSNSANIVIAEPDQSLTKTITTIPADAGDPVRYTLVLSNNETGNNDATAFDLKLTDTFDAELIEASLNIDSVAFTQVGGTCTGNGAGTTPFSQDGGSFSGYDFTLTATCLDPGRTITVIISAVLKDDVPASYDLRNAADLAWTSLPGDKGTAANPTGSNVDDTSTTEDESGGSRGERNGSETPAINDYNTTDDADVDLTAPSIIKSVEAPAQWTIGESFTYDLVITLPEGVTPDMVVYDDIPDGLEFISYNLITTTAEAGSLLSANYDGTFTNASPTATVLPSGDLELNFGDTTTNEEYPDSDPTNNRFQVQVDVRMLNVAGNQNGGTLTNQGEVRYSSGTTATGTVDITVIEPLLVIDKTIDDDTPGLDQTITYTLEIAHDLDGAGEDSQSDAFNVQVTDTLPAGLSNLTNITTSSTGNCATGFNTAGSTASVLDVTINEIPHSLPSPGCVVTITFDSTVDSEPDPNTPDWGDGIDNTAEITWTSIQTSNGHERSGDGVAGNVDDYETGDSQSVIITNPELKISKDDGVGVYIPGSYVTYDITVENIGNEDVVNALVTDNIPGPSQVDYWDWECIGATGSATGCTQDLGLTGNFSDLINLPENLPAGSSITYRVTTYLLSSATGNLDNVVTVDMPAGVIEPTPGDNTAQDIDIQESHADLAIDKDDGINMISPGGTITYTVRVDNLSPSDVIGAIVEDLIPTEIDSWVWACTHAGGASGCTAAANNSLDFNDTVNLPAGSSITYTITAQVSTSASGTLTNEATVTVPFGVTDDDLSNNSEDDIDGIPEHSKTLIGSYHGVTTLPDVAIGERLTYEVVLTIPIGGSLPNLHLVDTLDLGLAYLDCDLTVSPNPVVSAGISTDFGGGSTTDFSTVCANVLVTPIGSADPTLDGRQMDYDFGDLSNAGPGPATVTLTYEVVVLDSLGNQSGSTPLLVNDAEWLWDSGVLTDQADGVNILEPDMTISKSAFPTRLYPGQLTTFTLTVEHNPGSQTSAFDVEIEDIIPSDLIFQSAVNVSGQAPTAIIIAGDPTILIQWDEFLNDGTNSVIDIVVQLDPAFRRTKQNQFITNDASLSWTSLPGDISSAQSIHNPLSTERFYDPLSNINIYGVGDAANIRVPALPDTGFAPGTVTDLPLQVEGQEYGDLDGLRIEIPVLGQSVPIVSVPLNNNGWDLTWLWNQAGWLEGTAYPSWYGNTVITGHAYLPSGYPGPFVNLGDLSWGDEIILYVHGLKYTYQVRFMELVAADDYSILQHKDQDWLTLFTCKEYSDLIGGYLWRQAVQAVLIDVEQID